jgi:hypothetical protein
MVAASLSPAAGAPAGARRQGGTRRRPDSQRVSGGASSPGWSTPESALLDTRRPVRNTERTSSSARTSWSRHRPRRGSRRQGREPACPSCCRPAGRRHAGRSGPVCSNATCTCASTTPGNSVASANSTTSACSGATAPDRSTATMRPPSTSTITRPRVTATPSNRACALNGSNLALLVVTDLAERGSAEWRGRFAICSPDSRSVAAVRRRGR